MGMGGYEWAGRFQPGKTCLVKQYMWCGQDEPDGQCSVIQGRRQQERGYREFCSSMCDSSARWEEGGDTANTTVPLAFSSMDTGRSRTVRLHVLGHGAWL